MSDGQFLRMKDLVVKTALSKTEIHRRIRAGRFPAPKRLSHRVAVWPREVVEKWMEETLAN